MRILVLTHEYPPIGGGGGRVAQDICNGLAERGHQVQVLTAHCGNLPNREKQGNVRIRRVRSGRSLPYKADLKAMAGFVIRSFWDGLDIVRSWRPEVIHTHFAVPAGASACGLSLMTGVPYVLTAHLGDVPGGVPEKTKNWFRWVFPFTPPIWRRAARVIAVSEFTRQLALQKYSVEINVIPNGVSLEEIDPGKIQLTVPPRVIFAGRFVPQKNPLQIVRTLAALRDIPWNCVMLGDGLLREDVEREIKIFNLQDRFTLPGWVKPEEVLDWCRCSDVLFMPSLSEGLSVVGVQALAMGMAMVLSRVGGNVDLVREGVNGNLLDRGNNPGFEKALRALLSDPNRLLKARIASREHAARFDIRSVVESYEQIFLQLRCHQE